MTIRVKPRFHQCLHTLLELTGKAEINLEKFGVIAWDPKLATKIQFSGVDTNKLGKLLLTDFSSFLVLKIDNLSVFRNPTEPMLNS